MAKVTEINSADLTEFLESVGYVGPKAQRLPGRLAASSVREGQIDHARVSRGRTGLARRHCSGAAPSSTGTACCTPTSLI